MCVVLLVASCERVCDCVRAIVFVRLYLRACELASARMRGCARETTCACVSAWVRGCAHDFVWLRECVRVRVYA